LEFGAPDENGRLLPDAIVIAQLGHMRSAIGWRGKGRSVAGSTEARGNEDTHWHQPQLPLPLPHGSNRGSAGGRSGQREVSGWRRPLAFCMGSPRPAVLGGRLTRGQHCQVPRASRTPLDGLGVDPNFTAA
jgi:hypothetical protein